MTPQNYIEGVLEKFEVECIHAHAKSLGQEYMNEWLRTSLTDYQKLLVEKVEKLFDDSYENWTTPDLADVLEIIRGGKE